MRIITRCSFIMLLCVLAIVCRPNFGASRLAGEPVSAEVAEGTEAWRTAWMLNTTGATSDIFDGATVNVSAVSAVMIDGKPYQCIVASGIPNYENNLLSKTEGGAKPYPQLPRNYSYGEKRSKL